MQKIIFPNHHNPDPNSNRTQFKRYYWIAIGGFHIREKSEVKILKMKAHLQKMYTKKLYEANLLAIEFYKMYRLAWSYSDNNFKTIRDLGFDIKAVDDMLQRSTEHRGPNANQFIYDAIKKAFETMESGFLTISEIFSRANHYDRRQTCELLSDRARAYNNDIESMLELLAYNEITMPEPFRTRFVWMHQQRNYIKEFMAEFEERKDSSPK